MNQFKFLDSFFPVGSERKFGEVVTCQVTFFVNEYADKDPGLFAKAIKTVDVGTHWWKRKAWYVNASVNAFHMHRGLCSEVKNQPWFLELSTLRQRLVKKMLAQAVVVSYMRNHAFDDQVTLFNFMIEHDGKLYLNSSPQRGLSLWRVEYDHLTDNAPMMYECCLPKRNGS
jgi:hypothetical protein